MKKRLLIILTVPCTALCLVPAAVPAANAVKNVTSEEELNAAVKTDAEAAKVSNSNPSIYNNRCDCNSFTPR